MIKLNLENVNALIETIEEANKVCLLEWQSLKNYRTGIIKTSVREINECGTTACIGGYMAITQKFRDDGGYASFDSGCPIIKNEGGNRLLAEDAGSYWLGISKEDCIVLFGIKERLDEVLKLYKKDHLLEIEKEDVLEVLYRLRDTGSIYE